MLAVAFFAPSLAGRAAGVTEEELAVRRPPGRTGPLEAVEVDDVGDLREAEVTVRGFGGAVEGEAVVEVAVGVADTAGEGRAEVGFEVAGWSKLLKKSSSEGGGFGIGAVTAPSTKIPSGNLGERNQIVFRKIVE